MDHYVTGGVIRALREKKKLTQSALADRIGVSDKAVSKWETGVHLDKDTTPIPIRYNKLRKLKKDKNRHGLQTSGRMKLPHTILRGVCKPCPRKLYS